jgi:DNA-binding NarL/FixJ family response regulator
VKPTTVVLADDHEAIRRGLRILLETDERFRVVGEAKDGVQAADIVRRLKPDVLVVDLMMPGINGLEVTEQARRLSPLTEVVILSMYVDEAYVLEALQAGAKAYVLKSAASDQLVRAIREAARGRRYLSSPLSERAVERYVERAEDSALDVTGDLTPREWEVLRLAAKGCGTSRIATALSVSNRTAQRHCASLMRKLGLRTQTDLARYAASQCGLPRET